jgi:hypothetical protein
MACGCGKRRTLAAQPTVRQIRESTPSYVVIYSNGTESPIYPKLADAQAVWRQAKVTDPSVRLVERRV